MIGPFSTTLVPLSSSSSVDRQVLINVEASAISPDERTFGLSLQKYPFTRRSDEEEKKKDRGAWTGSPVLSVCLRPPKKYFSTSRRCLKIWNLRVQINLNIEKIAFKVVQIKFVAIHMKF